jgi:hypothetical protein
VISLNSNWIGNYSFKIFALIVLILFVLGIAFLEVQFFLEQQEPSIWEKNGDLFIAEVEGFQNGTVILNLWNSGPVPVNLTEVFLKEVEVTNRSINGEIVEVSHVKSEKLQVITSVRQEILVNTEVTVPIGVTFSTENLDFDKKYSVGVSWTTETGQGSASKTDFVFLV